MKKTIYLMTFLFSLLLCSTNLIAQSSCSYAGGASHPPCKGLWTTVYISKNATEPIQFTISAPSEGVLGFAGPNTDTSYIKDGSSIIVTIGSVPLEELAWMEMAVPNGYYHIRLIVQ
ncbi:MAG: hypothetical protein LUD02_00295 [Tannerellaceae bacterium]|nr:hypothetical protein [Tannerellaceae bacterium]